MLIEIIMDKDIEEDKILLIPKDIYLKALNGVNISEKEINERKNEFGLIFNIGKINDDKI